VRPARASASALITGSLLPILLLALAFPEGGSEPFSGRAFWPVVIAMVLIAASLKHVTRSQKLLSTAETAPQTAGVLSLGAWLYALALAGAYVLHTPVGANAVRLGELVGPPLLVGVLWDRRRLLLALLAPALLYWQLQASLFDLASALGETSVSASYYEPLLGELDLRAHGMPVRVEVAMLASHWESVDLPDHGPILLARGWERQLDLRYASLFYRTPLTATGYRAWLSENGVSYVALAGASLDASARTEGRLIESGLPYLREVWHSANWRLYRVLDATPLAQRPARLTAVGTDWFKLAAPRAASYRVRVRFTAYWALTGGDGCVQRAPGGWTTILARRPGTIRVGISFSPTRVFDSGRRCHV
jgi:hypothetical protein